jgi:hypothetical protein
LAGDDGGELGAQQGWSAGTTSRPQIELDAS